MRHQTERSKTWMIFEKHMMGRKPDQGNFEFPDMNRGSAINLCQGLNAAQAYWQKKLGLPDSEIFFSAKAKKREDGNWYVEISEAHTKQGTRNRGNAALLQSLLDLPASIPSSAPIVMPVKETTGTFFEPGDARAVNPDEEWMESMIFGQREK